VKRTFTPQRQYNGTMIQGSAQEAAQELYRKIKEMNIVK
jgi:hypothetical protein